MNEEENDKKFEVIDDVGKREKNIITYKAYGGFWKRLVASIVDWLPIYFSVMVLSIMAGSAKSIDGDLLSILIIIIILANAVCNGYFYFKDGATFGYKFFNMKIVSIKTGLKPTTIVLIWRWVVKTVIGIIPLGNLVIAFMIGLDGKKRGPHDYAAKTIVVSNDTKKYKTLWVFLGIIGLWFVILSAWSVVKFLEVHNDVENQNTLDKVPNKLVIPRIETENDINKINI